MPAVARKQAITTINLPSFILEGTGGSKTYEVIGTIPADWVKNGTYGIELKDSAIQGKAPDKAVAAKEFKVKITDTDNSIQTITIKLPQIT